MHDNDLSESQKKGQSNEAEKHAFPPILEVSCYLLIKIFIFYGMAFPWNDRDTINTMAKARNSIPNAQ